MTWMGTLRRAKKPAGLLLVLLFWVAAGYLGYRVFPSKMSGDWDQLERMFTRVSSWNSFYVDERVLGDEQTLVEVKGSINHEPKQGRFQINMRIRDNEYFGLESFLDGEQIYIHNLQEGNWVQFDSGYPTAGELTAVINPIEFWKILLTHVEQITRVEDGSLTHYRMKLRPFAESDHGMSFAAQEGMLSAWAETDTGNLQKLQLEMPSPENTLKSYKKVNYTVVFSGINEKFNPDIPAEARMAEKLK